jgi:hypothetical protein
MGFHFDEGLNRSRRVKEDTEWAGEMRRRLYGQEWCPVEQEDRSVESPPPAKQAAQIIRFKPSQKRRRIRLREVDIVRFPENERDRRRQSLEQIVREGFHRSIARWRRQTRNSRVDEER